MQLNHAEQNTDLNTQHPETSFSSIWGNAMQREDFLALAAGLRQFNATQSDVTFSSGGMLYAAEQQACS